jgi:hypothetical protein
MIKLIVTANDIIAPEKNTPVSMPADEIGSLLLLTGHGQIHR